MKSRFQASIFAVSFNPGRATTPPKEGYVFVRRVPGGERPLFDAARESICPKQAGDNHAPSMPRYQNAVKVVSWAA